MPTTGCSIDAVHWKASVMNPIWPNDSAYESLRIGYSAGTSDCIMSLSRWQKLSDRMTAKVVLLAEAAPEWAGAAGAETGATPAAIVLSVMRPV